MENWKENKHTKIMLVIPQIDVIVKTIKGHKQTKTITKEPKPLLALSQPHIQ